MKPPLLRLRLRNSERNGYSLIEMMCTIAVGTMVMNAIFPWLIRLMKEGESLSSQVSTSLSVQDMVHRLRCDARDASDLVLIDQSVLLLKLKDVTIEWRFQDSEVQRNAKISNGTPTRDVFRFPSRVGLERFSADEIERLSLTVDVPRRSSNGTKSLKAPEMYRIPIELTIGRVGKGVAE